jgi:uncharacterized protein involved in exopolysaccharide biosynthesis
MALSPITPRDRLQRLVDLGRKTWRYWWLVAVFAVAGGGLSLVFALTRPRVYLSSSTLFYQERIQSQLLSPNREEIATRNIGDRFRELLLAHPQLEQITSDPALDAFATEHNPEVKIEKLRTAIHFGSRGASAFRIEYKDSDPERAKLVTEKLTKLLQEKEEALRNEQSAATVAFATEQRETASQELGKRETALNEFLAKHPEFVQDTNSALNEGASIRASRATKIAAGTPGLSIKERYLQRILARLEAPPNSPPVVVAMPQTPERVQAEAQLQEANRELAAAQRELDDALSKYTDKHPTAVRAQEKVNNAKEKIRRAQAAVPPMVETIVQPATPEDRAKLERQRQQLETEIAEEKSRSGKSAATAADTTTKRVVELEIENSNLRRLVTEQRERVQFFADAVFRATMQANQQLAEQGGRLSIIDPAFKPVQPTGPGKTIFLMAGMLLFVTLGLSLAVALAIIDDRLYRRVDLDQLGVPVLAVIPPAIAHRRTRKRPTGSLPRPVKRSGSESGPPGPMARGRAPTPGTTGGTE